MQKHHKKLEQRTRILTIFPFKSDSPAVLQPNPDCTYRHVAENPSSAEKRDFLETTLRCEELPPPQQWRLWLLPGKPPPSHWPEKKPAEALPCLHIRCISFSWLFIAVPAATFCLGSVTTIRAAVILILGSHCSNPCCER